MTLKGIYEKDLYESTKRGLFISASSYLSDASGGVQRCTREYIEVIGAAGWELEILSYPIDRKWTTRLRRKIYPSSFFNKISKSFISDVVHRVQAEKSHWVFINQVDGLPLVPSIRKASPNVKIVLLSHGAQFVDDFIAARSLDSLSTRARALLTETILDESFLRQPLDHVFTLSQQEIAFERWLGAKSVSWLPRSIASAPLDWKPSLGRFGFVGTLNHIPNYEGLFNTLEALQTYSSFEGRIRIVSGSEDIGNDLGRRFSFVDYLGYLSPEALRSEAATWCCFLHPLFSWSRGCSTKLADALEWQIPILTTEQGCRGYTWKDGSIVKARRVEDFCNLLIHMQSEKHVQLVRENVVAAAKASPSVEDVSSMVKDELCKL